MNNTVKIFKDAQDKQIMNGIDLLLKAENHKKYTVLLLKKNLKKLSEERICLENNRIYCSCTNSTTNCR